MRPQSVEEAIAQVSRVVVLLRLNGADGWAENLESCVAEMTARYSAKEALLTIGGWCHAKALGEAIQSDAWWEWQEEVERLRDSCAHAFNELEQMPSDPALWE